MVVPALGRDVVPQAGQSTTESASSRPTSPQPGLKEQLPSQPNDADADNDPDASPSPPSSPSGAKATTPACALCQVLLTSQQLIAGLDSNQLGCLALVVGLQPDAAEVLLEKQKGAGEAPAASAPPGSLLLPSSAHLPPLFFRELQPCLISPLLPV